MSITAASKFKSIRDFPELVEYLGDELDWPIETDDFDEMTFEYSAAELGLDEKTAPKFLEIRRLRPLDNNQPWGIFFIRFDVKKLPIVALRRLLSKLVLKKRSTSNAGDRGSWHESDLLLISQTGKLGTQSISFAHFAANPEKTDLPILKVLGWDDDDTGLKIDYVIETLREKLIWPDDPTNSDAWRAQWRDAFTLKNREVIQSSKEMAERLGQLALAVRTRLREVLAIESEEGPIHKLMSVFKANLISDLDTDSFSDMYAQTIAYGLLSARIINPKANTADAAHTQIPITNPFLRDLMETFLNVGGRSHSSGVGLDFDELGINEVVDLLDNSNMEAVLRDFGDRNQKEDPVMHFFEGFLKEYDSKIRKDRGVFYTPQPVVSFIVRSVDEELRTEFELEDGLADTTTWGELAARITDLKIPEGTSPDQAFVQILDPSTGTGTFPVEVIDLIYRTMTAKWQAQGCREAQIKELWNDYVPRHLLPRLHGYELMMAPYAIAHMKIGLKLYETGYRFKSDQRARVYLTNALEPAQDDSGTFAFAIPALAHEAEAVNTIKKDQKFTVVIGNPPYSGHSTNKGVWITRMLRGDHEDRVPSYFEIDGQPLSESNTKWLNDDYVKFIRLSQSAISSSSAGVFGFITNSSYLDNPTFRGMRWSLFETYDEIFIHDLHGSLKKQDISPDGSKDENVFDIQQGVAIQIATKSSRLSKKRHQIFHRDLFGTRSEKIDLLGPSCPKTSLNQFVSTAPSFLLVPQDESLLKEFLQGFSIADIMPEYSLGCLTKRDNLVIGFDKEEVVEKIQRFIDPEKSDAEAADEFGVRISDNDMWSTENARRSIAKEDIESHVRCEAYRPFDNRWIFYHKKFVARLNRRVMRHLERDNLALVLVRQLASTPFDHAWVTNQLADQCLISNRTKEGGTVFPMLLEKNDNELEFNEDRLFNLSDAFSQKFNSLNISSHLTVKEKSRDIFYFNYAQLYSKSYRLRYEEFLKREFPRVFLPKSSEMFHKLSSLGAELIQIQLLNTVVANKLSLEYVGERRLPIEKVSYSEETVWIDKAKTRGFIGVPEAVWGFHIGGYRVCEKWIKDRGPKKGNLGRVLTNDDIAHYKKIVLAISETIRIMTKIDEVIDLHGGWPDAFVTTDR